MQAIALVLVTAAGLWLVAVALLMALRPRHCLHLLETMRANLLRSNWRLQVIEQGLRILAGAALIVRAPESRLPLAFAVAGWILVATSAVILIAPIRWHGTFGTWWVDRFRPWMMVLLSPVPAVVGVGMIYAATPY